MMLLLSSGRVVVTALPFNKISFGDLLWTYTYNGGMKQYKIYMTDMHGHDFER